MVSHPRIRVIHEAEHRPDGQYVLYWMIANRRPHYNFSLDRALAWCREIRRPLVVLEALRCDYPWASTRFHQFVIEGMRDNARRFASSPVKYYPFVESRKGEGKGLLQALSRKACVVVTDDFPCFFLPKMVESAGSKIGARLEAVDSNGLLPLRSMGKAFTTAYAFRRQMQKMIAQSLQEFPNADPLKDLVLPAAPSMDPRIEKQWPALSLEELDQSAGFVGSLPIDQTVGPGADEGGYVAARSELKSFLTQRLSGYGENRNRPETPTTSQLSPYLHFGHLSSHQVFMEVTHKESWSPDVLEDAPRRGSREGFWQMSAEAEGYLDQLITWREVGYNGCTYIPDYDQYSSLPEWAQKTLSDHRGDPRPQVYSAAEFEQGETHDELWNAAQRQLVVEGRVHNYLRMLWGKKILEWSQTPEEALQTMTHLNNKYALDGRNPNSYSGIFWVLGRYDRAWGPERQIFGKVRFMSSKNTARKVPVKGYLKKWLSGDSA